MPSLLKTPPTTGFLSRKSFRERNTFGGNLHSTLSQALVNPGVGKGLLPRAQKVLVHTSDHKAHLGRLWYGENSTEMWMLHLPFDITLVSEERIECIDARICLQIAETHLERARKGFANWKCSHNWMWLGYHCKKELRRHATLS